MCKCRALDCWYLNCCKSFVGQGCFCVYCGYLCFNQRTNMMIPSYTAFCLTCFCCRWLGIGSANLGTSSICCAPVEFDDPFAEMKLDELTKQLQAGSIKRDPGLSIGTEQRVYNY